MLIRIIDYGTGNIWSICSILTYLGCNFSITSNPSEVSKADALILPGVGSFRNAMHSLKHNQLEDAIFEAVKGRRRKILGICLGMQLLGTKGAEDGETLGLGLMSASVDGFDFRVNRSLKVPHVGFNQVYGENRGTLYKGIPVNADFYFVHSYRMLSEGLSGYQGLCMYGQEFLASYENENIFATQFHPEKSQTNGIKLIKNFLEC